MYYYIMTQKRIINFDTFYSSKISNNPFNTNFFLTETLRNISKITLKSIEIPISNYNLRAPYSTIQIKYNNIVYSYTMNDKTYVDITSFLTDLNLLISPIQTYMYSSEVAPIFSLSTTELNKLVVTVSLLSTSTIYFYSTGLFSYYLGNISSTYTTKILVSNSLYLYSYNLINVYNLCFDNYYSMIISNLDNQTSNNNLYPCHFKLIVNAQNNTIYICGENTSFIQSLELNNKTLTNLNIEIRDRYNNLIINQLDYSFTLEFQYN